MLLLVAFHGSNARLAGSPTMSISAESILVTRVAADANFLFPKNSKRLTRFMMDETYGQCQPFSAAWAQRSVLDAAADSDFFGRLKYYDEQRTAGRPQGDVFIAEKADGSLAGFADLGASLWLPNDRAFRLPQSPDLQRLAETGVGTDGQLKTGVELRPYVSNLVVDASLRRCGVGRRLMEACEEAARSWAAEREDATPYIWLEVTESNEAGIAFYRALGYEVDGSSAGSEVTRDGDAFSMVEVRRCVMKKALGLRGGYCVAGGGHAVRSRCCHSRHAAVQSVGAAGDAEDGGDGGVKGDGEGDGGVQGGGSKALSPLAMAAMDMMEEEEDELASYWDRYDAAKSGDASAAASTAAAQPAALEAEHGDMEGLSAVEKEARTRTLLNRWYASRGIGERDTMRTVITPQLSHTCARSQLPLSAVEPLTHTTYTSLTTT